MKFKIRKFSYYFSSPLKRALETTKLISNNNSSIIIDKNLNEIDYGIYEGKDISYMRSINKKFLTKWSQGIDVKFPKGENSKDVYLRTKKFCRRLTKILSSEMINKPILIISHNVFLRCLIGSYYNIDMKDWHLIDIKHLKEFKFIFYENKILPNIKRKDQFYLFKKIYA